MEERGIICRRLAPVLAIVIALWVTEGETVAQRASERRVANPGETQFNLQVLRASGGPVIPIFEGWYQNPDGTYELSFGYYNVNTEEVLEVPLGPDNFIEPQELDGGQPTRFETAPEGDRRHWGVFTATVPADFGDRDVVWTLRSSGQTLSVPGRLTRAPYQLAGWEFPGRASMAPLVRWEPNGPVGRGPAGVMGPPLRATVGVPRMINVWTTRDPEGPDDERPIHVKWFKHQGPGLVTFAEPTSEVDPLFWATPGDGAEVATQVTFADAGHYVVRALAFNEIREFEFQCCWTNAFVQVIVEP